MAEEKPHYHGHRKRLKDRYLKTGLDALEDYEVLELLLTHSQPRRDVKPAAKNLLKTFGGLKEVLEADSNDLTQVEGIGPGAALLIRLVKDLAVRYLDQTAKKKPHLGSTPELLRYCKAYFGGIKDEEFRVIFLDNHHHIIQVETLQQGTVNQAVVYPRKVLERALQHKASGIILVHNHPSGYVRPSPDDIRLTKIIAQTAAKLDIQVHDHLIIGGDTFYSLRERGDL
jgi:DNA repair protein RadC